MSIGSRTIGIPAPSRPRVKSNRSATMPFIRRALRSALRMNGMVADLLDFTRGRLGAGMPIVREPMDIGTAPRQAADEVLAANPDRPVRIEASGELEGAWDADRVSQLLANLLSN